MSYGTVYHNAIRNKITLTLDVPQRQLNVEVGATNGGSATVKETNNPTNISNEIINVSSNTTVTYDATPQEDYIFVGWCNEEEYVNTGGNPDIISTDATYSYTTSDDISIFAIFEEDTSDKATYLYEPITDQTYQLLDYEAVRLDDVSGNPITGRIARFRSDSNKI